MVAITEKPPAPSDRAIIAVLENKVNKQYARIRGLKTALDEIIELSSDNTKMPPPDSIRGRACSFEIDELMKICSIARKARGGER